MKIKNIATFILLFGFLSMFLGCTSKTQKKKEKVIVVGLAYSATYPKLFKYAIQPGLEQKGYKVIIKQINNSNMLNTALDEKDIDCNLVGHTAAMEFSAKRDHLNLSMLITVPSSVYGIHTIRLKAKNLTELKKELKKGDVVAIPNDPSNLSRGLIFLENIGLIKLNPNIDKNFAMERDIVENPYGLVFKPIDSAQSARILDSVAFSLVFGTEAYNAGIISSRIVRETIYDERYLVGVVIRTEDLGKPWTKDLIEVVQSERFKNAIENSQYIFKDFQRPQWYVKKWGIKNDSIN